MQSLTVERRTVSKEMSSTTVRQDVIFVHGNGSTDLRSGNAVSAGATGKPKAILIMASSIYEKQNTTKTLIPVGSRLVTCHTGFSSATSL